jgi:hypothetical protein
VCCTAGPRTLELSPYLANDAMHPELPLPLALIYPIYKPALTPRTQQLTHTLQLNCTN